MQARCWHRSFVKTWDTAVFKYHDRLGMVFHAVDDSIYCTSCNHALVLHSAVGCLGENFQCACVRSRDEVMGLKAEEHDKQEAVQA
jgi:hypothetical protein